MFIKETIQHQCAQFLSSNLLFVRSIEKYFSTAAECYLLVLVGCDCGELCFWEGEAVHSVSRQRLDLRQVHARVVFDDVHTWLVFMHRLKNDLHHETKNERLFIYLFFKVDINLESSFRSETDMSSITAACSFLFFI